MARSDRQRRRNGEPNRRRSNSYRRRRRFDWHHEPTGNTEAVAWWKANERLDRGKKGAA
jgi:hypothetical protein